MNSQCTSWIKNSRIAIHWPTFAQAATPEIATQQWMQAWVHLYHFALWYNVICQFISNSWNCNTIVNARLSLFGQWLRPLKVLIGPVCYLFSNVVHWNFAFSNLMSCHFTNSCKSKVVSALILQKSCPWNLKRWNEILDPFCEGKLTGCSVF